MRTEWNTKIAIFKRVSESSLIEIVNGSSIEIFKHATDVAGTYIYPFYIYTCILVRGILIYTVKR